MRTIQIALTPTNMANKKYCDRLFYINKTSPYRATSTTFPLVWGNFEHETFRILAGNFDTIWRQPSVKSLRDVSQEDLSSTIKHVYQLAIQNYPHFSLEMKKGIPDFWFRLNLWIDQKEILLNKLLADGFSKDYAVSTILPWKCEEKLFSDQYGIFGRVDAIYNDGRVLVPEDFKTHTNKFKTLLQQASHKIQLLCYCLMLEEKYSMPSPEAKILYTNDMTSVTFKANQEAKDDLIKEIHEARDLLSDEIPPMLEGAEAVKCKHCYARDQCFKLGKKQFDMNWIKQLTEDKIADLDDMRGQNHGN